MPWGIVVGLRQEGQIARIIGDVAIGGGTPEGAEIAAERLASGGAAALLSFGLAGGLDPTLRPGFFVVPEAVLEAGKTYLTDSAMSAALGGVTAPLLLAGDAIVAGAGDKQKLAAMTGACAVDLESGAVARVAARHALPFAVLRAICDPAERDLPPAALLALNDTGMIRLPRIIASVIARPGQIGTLLRLAGDAALARKALAGAASSLRRRLAE